MNERKFSKRKWILAAGICAVCMIILAVILLWQKNEVTSVNEETEYAGNYSRGSKRYEEFKAFVMDHAISKEKEENTSQYSLNKEDGIVYTLDSETVKEWGKPCNSHRFFIRKDELTEKLQKKGYQFSKIFEDEKNVVEMQKYGAILTTFSKREHYRFSEGVCVAIASDAVNSEVLIIKIYREDKSQEELAGVAAVICQQVSAACSRDTGELTQTIKEIEAKVNETKDRWYLEYNDCMVMIDNTENSLSIYIIPAEKYGGGSYYWP